MAIYERSKIAGRLWRDEEYVMLSALAHFAYCPRRCGLIHVEQSFAENRFTLSGQAAHERADAPLPTYETGMKRLRALPLWSERYGLIGRADVVEFYDDGSVAPVEYKRGALPRRNDRNRRADDFQLCAQALCLEEMRGHPVERGFVYSVQSRKRRDVTFDQALREETLDIIAAVRELLLDLEAPLPPAVNDARCPHCSLNALCVPETVHRARQTHHLRELFLCKEIL